MSTDNGSRKKRKVISKDAIVPPGFEELTNIFFRLNTFYTFLMSRKHVITSFDTLKPPVESAIKRKLEEIDLAKIAYLLPNDALFHYVDQNQILVERKHFDFKEGYQQKETDMFQLKDEDEEYGKNQILIFEFIDGDLTKSKAQGSSWNQIKMPTYTAQSMKKMIAKREQKFKEALNEFVESMRETGCDPVTRLGELAHSMLPHEKVYIDPIEAMLTKNKDVIDSGEAMPIDLFLEDLKSAETYKQQIVSSYKIPERSSEFKPLSFDISPNVMDALKSEDAKFSNFYSHQSDALDAINEGRNVIISTSTSSGKSLIYQLPAIDLLEKDTEATFMYIFPTKALAQDQKRSFMELMSKIPSLEKVLAETYDGDTTKEERDRIKKNARVIFTNPDMIHTSILPNHPNWRHFLMNLRFVVVDELHIYKGLFGSHVALVMRRLRRLCTWLGNHSVQFISCSATLKNPVEHMGSIFGVDNIVHIDKDGSPSGAKHLVIWNPAYVNSKDKSAGRESFIHDSAKLLVKLVLHNVRTIAFCYVRRVCELLMKEVRNIFVKMGRPELVNEVMSYRGGYSASDRRSIEQEMFHGNLKAVISTNALELGIDVGGLDAVLMCGFPLSLANFHQQSGRAGRRNKDSLTLVVGSNSPVDQHYVNHSELLLKKDEFQELVLDFENALILEGHIQCAAFELPIDIDRDSLYFQRKQLEKICEERLIQDEHGYHTNNRFLPWPSKNVSLRGVEEDQYAVVDITNGRNIVIEEIEASRTSFTLYDGGIFIHQGYPYLVREFNPDGRYAKVERVDVDWVATQRDFTDVDPIETEYVRSLPDSETAVFFGKIRSTIVVFGFFKKDKYGQILDAVEVNNPPVIINSKGFWIDVPKKAIEVIRLKNLNLAGGIHAAEHAIMGLLPMFIVAGVDEIQTECKAPEKEFAKRQTKRLRPARLIFFDSKGGEYGSGLSIKAFEHIDDILIGALQRIFECPCSWGCPDCVAASFCKENSLVLSKPAALIILLTILGKDFDASLIANGPEPNMPDINVETIQEVTTHVKFSPDVQIMDVKPASKPLVKLEDHGIIVTKVVKNTGNPAFYVSDQQGPSLFVKEESDEEEF